MMFSRFALFIAIGCCAIFFAADAPAAVVFSFATDQPSYAISPGATATIDVFLKETDGVGDTDVLTSQGGLIGYDLNLSVSSGTGAIVEANPTPTPASFSSVFDSQSSPATITPPGVTSIDLALLSADDPGPTGTAAGMSRTVLLASFQVTGGSAPGSGTSFVIQDSAYYGTNTITNAGTALDPLIKADTFNVNVIAPEPTSSGLLGVLVIFFRRKRRSNFPAIISSVRD